MSQSGKASPATLIVVRLTRKYAEMINGVDLAGYEVGDILRLPSRDAALLIAEGWASACARPSEDRRQQSPTPALDRAADHSS